MWALTSEAIMLTGDTVVVTSWATLGLDGRRPLRPFRLSVLTTGIMVNCYFQFSVTILIVPPFIRVCTELTFPHHAYSKALLETAELASIPPPFVHRTVLVGKANVLGIFLYCTL